MDKHRRILLQLLASGAVSGVVLGAASLGRSQNLVRPPGALHEPDFMARCQRCNRCLDACTPEAITLAHPGDGLGTIGTPVLNVNKCIWCMECIRACPSGALSKIPKTEVHVGVAVIDKSKCLAWLKTKRCNDCEKACRERKAVAMKERRYPEIVADKCNGCAICVRRCPAEGAITIDGSFARRYDAHPERLVTALPDRVGPYDVAPPTYDQWLLNRLRVLAQHYGLPVE